MSVRNAALPVDLTRLMQRLELPRKIVRHGSYVASRVAYSRSRAAAIRSQSVPHVVMCSDIAVDPRQPYVTFDDMTVAQALREPSYGYADISASHQRWWLHRQRELYRGAVGCCVGSQWTAESVIHDYQIPPERVHAIGRGHSVTSQVLERDWGSPRYLFAGRDWQRKNADRVLDAFMRVQSLIPAATLDLVGPPVSSYDLAQMPGVNVHGPLELGDELDRRTLMRLYAESTCFVMPSLCEAFGIAYLEAGACGVGSIGTANGGAADAIGEGGLVVDPRDPALIAAAMLRFADPLEAREFGRLARARAADYTWERVAGRILSVLLSS